MALGRTQAPYTHLDARAARIQADKARIEAAQARLEAEIARQPFPDVWISNPDQFDGPNVRVSGPERMVVCPHIKVRVATPELSSPQVRPMQDPI
jgi:hypothetical protein